MGSAVVLRGSRNRVEAERDRAMLEWIARFRFVTAEVVATRFELSPQRVNARMRQLADAGLVVLQDRAVGEARAIAISARGARWIGAPPRRAPRFDAQRRHELAIAVFVAEHERAHPAVAARTEREQRTAEADGAHQFSVALAPGGPRNERCRWADVVLDDGPRRIAVELELSTKAPERLKRIVDGYAACQHFDEVRFLVRERALAKRLTDLTLAAGRQSELARMLDLAGPRFTVTAWQTAP